MTDFTVAYLRDPALLQAKADAVYVVAASAEHPVQDHIYTQLSARGNGLSPPWWFVWTL
jgi:hypothetical protein